MKLFAGSDSVLHDHLHHPTAKNIIYLSSKSQNHIINVICYDAVHAKIVKEISQAGFFSVLVNEVSSHNVEHVPICLCFVDEKCYIREDFVAFVRLERLRASDITKAIVDMIEELGLYLDDLHGQGYDGTAAMRRKKAEEQKQIRDIQPKAVYTHCAWHSLNLSIISSCSIPLISNSIKQIKTFTLRVKCFTKCEGLLKGVCN